jgi:hypothetical protein
MIHLEISSDRNIRIAAVRMVSIIGEDSVVVLTPRRIDRDFLEVRRKIQRNGKVT